MRALTTVLCSIAFLISGIMMALTASDPSPGNSYKTMSAATPLPNAMFAIAGQDTATLDLPEDILRDLAMKKGVLDTVYITKTDTIKERVTKVKVKKVPVPSNIMEINVSKTRTDTIRVPVYYIATQVGMKEEPKEECVSVYEVHKVDKICPETINSSVLPVTKQDSDVEE